MPDDPIKSEQAILGGVHLTFFLNDRLVPVLRQFASIDSATGPQRSFLHAELLECYLWLHHGMVINYFPLAPSRRVTYEYFHLFLRAYESASSEANFDTWFTSPIRAIWESEFTGNQELFSAGRIWNKSDPPLDADSFFQPLFILSNGFAQNPTARPFVQALVVSPEAEWQQSAASNVPMTWLGLPENKRGGNDASSHWMNPGFLVLIEYMQAYRSLNADLRQTSSIMDKELQDYLRLLKETQQWRLNCGYLQYRERLVQAGRSAAETNIKHLSGAEPNDSNTVVENFIKSLRDLMTDWGAPLVKAADA
jgi:hypothetical protein